jgi:hypothetical protein
MRRIAEKDLIAMSANPAAPHPAGNQAADRR